MFKTFLYNSFPQCTKALKYFLLLLFVLLIPALVKAQEMDSLEIAQKLQSTYEKALNLVADFKQTTAMKFSSRVRQGSGTMIFRKPGRMRWDYRSPDYQVLISDGETISMYFEKSNQMIVSNAREYLQSDVTYSFFAGTGDILKDFDVSDPDLVTDSMDNSFLIKLTPKSSHPHVSSIHAWISHDSFLITHLQIVDHFETVTDLFFFNILINADHYGSREIKEDLFLFIPPADTEIIEQY
jgi:outer membrane lipoprotein carrier protein